MTVYPKAYADVQSIFEFSMTKAPGRSYKYYDGSVGDPLIAFGTGLSYSTFDVKCSGGLLVGAPSVIINCTVTNLHGPEGDEVLLVYHRPSVDIVARVAGTHPLPLRALVGFERTSVAAGGSTPVSFELPVVEALGFVNQDGATALYPGVHFLDVSNGNAQNVTIAVVFEASDNNDAAVIVKRPPQPADLVSGQPAGAGRTQT
jgi:beta-glucosidase